ncbi:MAG: ATP-binding cassette domain-containing protein [Deltaproteobacteria bacterium]|nr:ATP-binding cassette domain-containing protein [Deltaproteobacteria bacterium]
MTMAAIVDARRDRRFFAPIVPGAYDRGMIELAGVRLERPRAAASLLTGVDLSVGRGEVVLVSGGAGAGTSTLVAALYGDVAPVEGRVALFGRELGRLRRSSLLALRRRLGVVPQDLQLLPECSALANVVLPLEIDHVPRRDAEARATAALEQVGMSDDALVPVANLSMAARQKVAVARALVRQPSVIVADQPTAHQDADGAERIATALATAADHGAAVLITARDAHLLAAAARRSWRQLMIHGGRLIDVTDVVSFDVDVDIDVDDNEELVIETTEAPVEEAVPNVIVFPLSARSRGAR